MLVHGIDLVEITRVQHLLDRHGKRFLARVFTEGEQRKGRESKRYAQHLAGRFAAKEAVIKAFGTGLSGGVAWTDIEVASLPSGQPVIRLSGKAAMIAAALGVSSWSLSISHTDSHAVASVIGS